MERNSEDFHGTAELSQLTTEKLAELFQLGSDEAFTALSKRLRPRLVCFLHHRLGNLEDAEDVAQDSLARAWQQRATFDPQFRFTTWLYAIAKRRATDHQRRRQHVAASQAEVDLEVAVISRPVDPSALCDGNIWSTAHQYLSVDQYSVTWLRYGEGLSIKEIATICGKSAGSIRVHLHRARGVLRRIMKDDARMQDSNVGVPSDGALPPNEAER